MDKNVCDNTLVFGSCYARSCIEVPSLKAGKAKMHASCRRKSLSQKPLPITRVRSSICSTDFRRNTKVRKKIIKKMERLTKAMDKKKVLTLTVSKEWFNKIVTGEKTEEYRVIKPYWASRLVNQQAESGEVLFDEFGGYCRVIGKLEYKPYTHVLFINGYRKDSPRIEKEIESIIIGKPKKGLCPSKWLDHEFFIIKFK